MLLNPGSVHVWKRLHPAQLVFFDLGTPKKEFNIYDELKKILKQMGVPTSQIAFVHDATTDARRRKLFEAVNNASVRILIGSTSKLGTGVNVQERLKIQCRQREQELKMMESVVVCTPGTLAKLEERKHRLEQDYQHYLTHRDVGTEYLQNRRGRGDASSAGNGKNGKDGKAADKSGTTENTENTENTRALVRVRMIVTSGI